MEKVLDIITAVIALAIAILVFIAVLLDRIPYWIRGAFFIGSMVLIAMSCFKPSAAFGFLNNPIGKPLYLILVSAFYFPDFNGFCAGGWLWCLVGVASLIGFFYGIVLLIIYIVLMATKKMDYKAC